MKRLTISTIMALAIATCGSVKSYANEATENVSTTAATEQTQAAILIQAKIDSGISLEDAISEVLVSNPELLADIAEFAASKNLDVDTFQSLAIASGADATAVANVTSQYTAAGPGQGANNGNPGVNPNNGVGQGRGNGRFNNRGNGNGAGGGGGDCGISEPCDN